MPSKISEKTWIIVPAYNEERYIERVLKKILPFTQNIVVVDDGSYDKTSFIASKYTKHVLVHETNLGKGAALKTGCDYAFNCLKGEYVVFLDADDQHDANEIELFWSGLEKGVNVVLGVRSFGNEMPLFRIMLNRLASYLVLVLFGEYIPDIPSGYKALSRKAYQELRWQSNNYAVEMEIAVKIAKKKILFSVVPIKTIYHDFDRGMTFLDTLSMIGQIIMWRISL